MQNAQRRARVKRVSLFSERPKSTDAVYLRFTQRTGLSEGAVPVFLRHRCNSFCYMAQCVANRKTRSDSLLSCQFFKCLQRAPSVLSMYYFVTFITDLFFCSISFRHLQLNIANLIILKAFVFLTNVTFFIQFSTKLDIY